MDRPNSFPLALTMTLAVAAALAGQPPHAPIEPNQAAAATLESDFPAVHRLLTAQCLDCHNATNREGGLNLARFESLGSLRRERATWKRVFEVVEAGQMPLHDSGYALTAADRERLLRFVSGLQALPDLELQAVDPGKPVLRRLTRLEYNNTVRDLFGLPYDLFMFPERLPITDKRYFLQATDGRLGTRVETAMREHGQKYDVLLPSEGLPGDNRAEYGYANRGDALNLSPLLFEKYLELAHAVAFSSRLEQDSPILAALLGRPWRPPVAASGAAVPADRVRPVPSKLASQATGRFASNGNVPQEATGNDLDRNAFAAELARAHGRGQGGTFDIPAAFNNDTVPGKGGLLRVSMGRVTLTLNPNIDLWLAAFATAAETSGEHLLTNKVKGEKTFELTFAITGGDDGAGVERLGVCVLARKSQRGRVTLTAVLADGRELIRRAEVSPEGGNVFFSFAAAEGALIRRLRVDGTGFSGDYVLLDDLGFILRGVPQTSPAKENLESPAVGQERPEDTRELPEPSRELPESGPKAMGDAGAAMALAIDPAQPLPGRLASFLRLAYRRPATAAEVDDMLVFIHAARQEGASEADAIKRAVQSVLASPEFLFLAEPVVPEGGKVRAVTDLELASRLSYFLWSSMPDAPLLELASQGKLAEPGTLRQQVRRMLRERRRSRELAESFAVQWLKLDQIYSAKPDSAMFREFYAGPQGKATLHGAMLTEPLLLFETVLVEDRSVLDLIDADFTWLNEQLAVLYGLQEPLRRARQAAMEAAATEAPAMEAGAGQTARKGDGRSWYRVALPDRTRGGVMTMAGPLLVTSLPYRTSPVKRGAWLLETILNRPPTEPKVAFVLDDQQPGDQAEVATLSIRQRFEKHRSDPSCFSCHSRIDPPGFSLETFDAIGRLRTHDGVQPVDASGVWNDRDFHGPAEFKAALRLREREFVRGFVEHLLSYALGRPAEHFDMPTVAAIVDAAAAQQYRLSAVLEGIVLSYPFRHTRNLQGE